MISIALYLLLASNATGKTLERAQQGTLVTSTSKKGPVISDDAGTVCHAWWDGVSVQDTKGCAWSMNGSVAQVAKAAPTPAGAGPYTGSNNYTLGTGNDAFDFSGNFSACFVFNAITAPASANFGLFSDHRDNVAGWGIYLGSGNTASLYFHRSGGSSTVAGVDAIAVGSPSIVCVGRSGTTGYIQTNLATYRSAAAGTITPDNTALAGMTRWNNSASAANVIIYEAWFSTTAPSSSLFTTIQTSVKSKLGITVW